MLVSGRRYLAAPVGNIVFSGSAFKAASILAINCKQQIRLNITTSAANEFDDAPGVVVANRVGETAHETVDNTVASPTAHHHGYRSQ